MGHSITKRQWGCKPLDRSLSAIFRTCHDYYLTNAAEAPRKGDALYEQVHAALTKTPRAMAAEHAVNYSGYTADERHAGYLIKLEPPMLLRAPYHVLPTFPTGSELEVLWTLSRTVRSGDATTISISGSNVLRLLFDLIGDIDFCEYFPIDDPRECDRIASNMDGTEQTACLKLALSGREWHYHWGDDRPTKEFFETTIKRLRRGHILNEDGLSGRR